MKKILLMMMAALLVFSLTACAWVKVTGKGEGVRVLQSAQSLESCKKLGNVNSKVISQFIFDRDAEKVAGELADLARNEAALMGGDTVVPVSKIIDGRRSFAVYQCFQPAR
jgi:hypothetical protein